jgi:microcystin-dependent protein
MMRYLKSLAAPLFASVLTALLVSGIANSALYQWSVTASTNATADPSINWSEGQSPSSVNDSARAMMAAIARYRDDISGTNTTTGTSSAYALNTSSVYPANPTGLMVAFRVHTTNADNATISIDGGTTYQIQTSPGVRVLAGTLIAGSPYTALHDGAAWVLRDFGSPTTVPLGALIPFTGDASPNSNFILPAGQAISRTTYATYFALVGTRFGSGDGSTTFNIPDLRGRAPFGGDAMGGSAANRITVAGGNFDGTVIGGTGGAQNKTIAQGNLPNVNFTVSGITLSDPGHSHSYSGPTANIANGTAPTTISAGVFGLTTSSDTTGITIATQGTAASGGSGTAVPIIPNALILNYLLRIL